MKTKLILLSLILLAPMSAIAQCKTDIAVDGKVVYWTDGNDLYGATLPVTVKLPPIDRGGWCNTKIAASNGHFYWIQPASDTLYGSRVANFKLTEVSTIDSGGWRDAPAIAASNGFLYWTHVDGNLYAITLNGLTKSGESRQVDSNGWENADIAVFGGHLYWTQPSADKLYGSKIDGFRRSGESREIYSGGWREARIAGLDGYLVWYQPANNQKVGVKIGNLQFQGSVLPLDNASFFASVPSAPVEKGKGGGGGSSVAGGSIGGTSGVKQCKSTPVAGTANISIPGVSSLGGNTSNVIITNKNWNRVNVEVRVGKGNSPESEQNCSLGTRPLNRNGSWSIPCGQIDIWYRRDADPNNPGQWTEWIHRPCYTGSAQTYRQDL